MKTTKIVNKETGEVYTSKEGVELVESVFEVGDIFIPKHNSIITKSKEVMVDGSKKKITEYKIIAFVKDKSDNKIIINDSEEIFVTLTKTQATSLQKKLNEDILINQKVFEVRNYESKEWGTQIGVFLKGKIVEPITWEEIENQEETKNE